MSKSNARIFPDVPTKTDIPEDLSPIKFAETFERHLDKINIKETSSLWIYLTTFLPYSTLPKEIGNKIYELILDALFDQEKFRNIDYVHIIFRGTLEDIEYFLRKLVENASERYSKMSPKQIQKIRNHAEQLHIPRNFVINIEFTSSRTFEGSYIIADSGVVMLLPTDTNEHFKSILPIKDTNFASIMQEYIEAKLSTVTHAQFPVFISVKKYKTCIDTLLNIIFSNIEMTKKNVQEIIEKIDSLIKYLGLIYLMFNNVGLKDIIMLTLPENLYELFDYIREVICKSADPSIHRNYPYYAHHDYEHALAVLRNVVLKILNGTSPILEENRFLRLNVLERFLLIVAAITHDIGLGFEVPTMEMMGIEWFEAFLEEFKRSAKDKIDELVKEGKNFVKEGNKVDIDKVLNYLRTDIEAIESLSKAIKFDIAKKAPKIETKGVLPKETLQSGESASKDLKRQEYKRMKIMAELLRRLHNVVTYILLNHFFRKTGKLKTYFIQYGDKGLLLQTLSRIALGHRDIKIIPLDNLNETDLVLKKKEKVVIDTIKYLIDERTLNINAKLLYEKANGIIEMKIREKLLAIILRFGDSIDVERRSRANPKYLFFRDIKNDPPQIEHWAYKILIDSVGLEKTGNSYVLKITYSIPFDIIVGLLEKNKKIKIQDPIEDIHRAMILTECKRVLEDLDDIVKSYSTIPEEHTKLLPNLKQNNGKAQIKLCKVVFSHKEDCVEYIDSKKIEEVMDYVYENNKLSNTDKKQTISLYLETIGSIILNKALDIYPEETIEIL